MRRRLFLCALLLVLFGPRAFAELLVEPRGAALPRSTVTAIAQDAHGFIWAGTPHGLFRYDGYEYHSLGSGLPSERITALARDGEGTLWIGTRRGLASLAPDAREPAPAPEELATASVTTLAALPGALAVGTASDGLLLIDSSGALRRWRHELLVSGSIPAGAVTAITGDHATLVAATSSGATVLIDRRTGALERIVSQVSSRDVVSALATGPGGEVWLGTTSGTLLRLDPGASAPTPVPIGGGSGPIVDLAVDPAGGLWIARERSPVARLDETRLERADGARGALAVHVDDDGLVWMGLHGGGLALHNPAVRRFERLFDPRRVNPAADPGIVWGVARAADDLWVASDRGVLRVASGGAVTRLAEPAGPAYAIAAQGSRLWVALGPRGLVRVDIGIGAEAIDAGGPVYALATAGELLLAGSSDAVVVIDAAGRRRTVTLPGRGDLVRSFARAPDGLVRVGTERGALHLIDPARAALAGDGTGEPLVGDGAPLLQLAPVADGGLVWVAAREEGALLVDGAGRVVRRLVPGRELEADLVYGVVADELGDVWMTTNAGLVRLDGRRGETVRFTSADGVAAGPFAAGSLALVDGRVYAGGHSSLTAFLPSAVVPSPFRPPVAVTAVRPLGSERDLPSGDGGLLRASVLLPGARADASSPIVLPRDARGVELVVAALDYADPRAIRYAHRLIGRDDEWVETGAGRRVVLAELRPGEHRLFVRATNSDGVLTTAPVELAIEIPEPAWQQPAVAFAIVAAGLLIVSALFVRRSRLVLERRTALEAEIARRTEDVRLSAAALEREVETRRRAEETLRSLQDELEHRVFVRTDALREANERLASEVAERSRAQAEAERALAQNRALLEEVHHRVKNNMQVVSSLLSLQSSQIDHRGARAAFDVSRQRIDAMAMIHERLYQGGDFSAVSMADYLDALLRSLQRLHGSRVRVETHVRARPVDLSLATPCGLIANELITNAMKHAFPPDAPGDARILIEFVEEGEGFRFTVADNGVGMDDDSGSAADVANQGGLGMKLVAVLASQLDATMSVRSGPGTAFGRGTEVTLAIRARREPDPYQTSRLPP